MFVSAAVILVGASVLAVGGVVVWAGVALSDSEAHTTGAPGLQNFQQNFHDLIEGRQEEQKSK